MRDQIKSIPPRPSKPDILLVEDTAELRSLLQDVLAEEGYRVLAVENGREALDYLLSLSGEEFPLLFLDLEMPQCGGEEVLEALCNQEKLLPSRVVLLSASEKLRKVARRFGIRTVLSKPFSIDHLIDAARKTFSALRSRQTA